MTECPLCDAESEYSWRCSECGKLLEGADGGDRDARTDGGDGIAVDGSGRFPDDAPEDLAELTSTVYVEHVFHHLHRSAAEEPVGGVTWRSDDEEVKVMNYAASGYWAVEASRREFDEDRDCWVTHGKSNGDVKGLDRREAYQLADEYMAGERELGESEDRRERQQTFGELVTDGGQVEDGTERQYITHCPLCGLKIHSVKTPGAIDPWRGDLPLMLNPCVCVVPSEVLRHGDKWATVVGENSTIGISGGVTVRLESSDEGLSPVAGDFDQIAMYDSAGPRKEEIVRYDLDEIKRSLHTGGDRDE
jgi:hypothetical protein